MNIKLWTRTCRYGEEAQKQRIMMMIASLIGGITSAIALNVDSLANAAQGSGMIMTFLILAVVLAVFSYLFQVQ